MSATTGRFEMKYAVPVLLRNELIRRSKPYMEPDKNAQKLKKRLGFKKAWGYSVHSLYFDSPRLDDYFERLQERNIRNRLRIRTYGNRDENAPIFLENKRKLDKRVVKQRVRICQSNEWRRVPGAYPWTPWLTNLEGTRDYTGKHFDWLIRSGRRRPVSLVHYVREIYVPRDATGGRLRFTLDHQVSVTRDPDIDDLFAEPDTLLIPSDWMVVELKYDRRPSAWMKQMIRELKLIAEPISKFGLSVARTHRSEKPHENRYLTPHSIRRVEYSSTETARGKI